jgi:6-pyruvoyltetrahydropterin/6-carboxytetrahydropterin synthase
MMVAHSFRGELFGPAQKMHGATYVVDVELRRAELGQEGVVVDIGRAHQALDRVLGELTFKNLDEEPAFAGQNTTTEFLSRAVFDRLRAAIVAGDLGPGSAELVSMRVTLHESHVAWASYEDRLRP